MVKMLYELLTLLVLNRLNSREVRGVGQKVGGNVHEIKHMDWRFWVCIAYGRPSGIDDVDSETVLN